MRRVRNQMVSLIAPPLVRLWGRTLRVRYSGVERRQGRVAELPHGIGLFWHQRIFAFAAVFHHTHAQALVSQHGDGEMLAASLRRLGIRSIRGSTTRGGANAVREILRQQSRHQGERICIVITPDGPRGPRYHLHPGAVYLAGRTGLPLHLVAVSYGSCVQLRTWDGFLFPRPFTRTLFHLGASIDVPPDLDRAGIESMRAEVEARLREMTEATDRNFDEMYRNAKALRELAEVPSGESP